ncbi:MAG: threonine synthase, partial [Candidatus Thermoplasmatota archaeon]
GTVSTGNMAASVSAYGARHELKTFVLVPSDIPDKKIEQIRTYEPIIIKVEGDYGDLYYESFEFGSDEIYFTNSNSPFRVEGYKTIAFEVYEKNLPDYVIIPTSSGGLFRGITKGFTELKKSGIIDEMPKFVSVQAEGCSPICKAFESDENEIERWSNPTTIASAISNPLPPGGNDVLRKLEEHEGICERVSDENISSAQNELAREGVFCQPSSAVGIAALKKLRKEDRIEKGADVVSIITGSGLKSEVVFDTDHAISHCELEELETCLGKFF